MSRKSNGHGKFASHESQNEDLSDLNRGLWILASLVAEKHLQKLGKAETLQSSGKGLKDDKH
jgi:hypothetical protein